MEDHDALEHGITGFAFPVCGCRHQVKQHRIRTQRVCRGRFVATTPPRHHILRLSAQRRSESVTTKGDAAAAARVAVNHIKKGQSEKSGGSVRMMFTGIVEEIGTVEAITNLDSEDGGVEMTIKAKVVLGRTQLGDSIAVNGTCLTVTHLDHDASTFKVGLAPETLRRTNLGKLQPSSRVNLERSLAADGRVGGHFVQGHVDGTGAIQAKRSEKDAIWFTICPEQRALLKYIVPKGYIAVDGTSLTVVNVTDSTFDFMMIPYTQDHVIQSSKVVGDLVNIEVDITGKYIEKFLTWRD